MRNRDGIVKVNRDVGINAVINEGDWYHEVRFRMHMGCVSICGPLCNTSHTNGEYLLQELRELKALLNAIPEI